MIFSGNGAISSGLIQVVAAKPSLFSTDSSGRGFVAGIVVRVKPDGSQSLESIAAFDQAANTFVAVPIDLSSETDQAYLVLFGTGIRHRQALGDVKVTIGDVLCPVEYAGAQEGFAGLDQINIRLPHGLAGRGEATVILTVEGLTANTVKVQIK